MGAAFRRVGVIGAVKSAAAGVVVMVGGLPVGGGGPDRCRRRGQAGAGYGASGKPTLPWRTSRKPGDLPAPSPRRRRADHDAGWSPPATSESMVGPPGFELQETVTAWRCRSGTRPGRRSTRSGDGRLNDREYFFTPPTMSGQQVGPTRAGFRRRNGAIGTSRFSDGVWGLSPRVSSRPQGRRHTRIWTTSTGVGCHAGIQGTADRARQNRLAEKAWITPPCDHLGPSASCLRHPARALSHAVRTAPA